MSKFIIKYGVHDHAANAIVPHQKTIHADDCAEAVQKFRSCGVFWTEIIDVVQK